MITAATADFSNFLFPQEGQLLRTRTRTTSVRLLPFAGELQGALADGFAEGLVRREGGETFGLRVALVSQKVNQTQRLTLRSQRGMAALGRPVVAHDFRAERVKCGKFQVAGYRPRRGYS